MKYVDRKPVIDAVHDLVWLAELARSTPSGHDIRRSTTVLRNLLLDHRTQDAWRLLDLPGHPYVETNTIAVPRIQILINGVPAPRLDVRRDPDVGLGLFNTSDEDIVALAPPVRGEGLITRHLSQSSFCNGPSPTIIRNRFKIVKFLDSAGLFALGKKISRRSAIEFICHKRGGAHLDWRIGENDKTKAFDVLQDIYDPQPQTVGNYTLEMSFRMGNLNEIETYILNIIRDLVDARDIQSLIRKASETFPDEFHRAAYAHALTLGQVAQEE